MSRKKTKLTPKLKQQIKESWYNISYSSLSGEALEFLKSTRKKSLARSAKAKKESAEKLRKEERSLRYYERNPIVVNGRPIPVDSASFEELRNEAKETGTALRTLVKQKERDGVIGERVSIYTRLPRVMDSIKKGDTIYINGRKSSKAALKKRFAEITTVTSNFSKGFDMHIMYDYDNEGNLYFNLPTNQELHDIQDIDDYEGLFGDFDGITVTLS